MVEGASIDKMSHPMDWDRALVDTIEFDKGVGVAREFAAKNPDTLIVVTGDHTHASRSSAPSTTTSRAPRCARRSAPTPMPAPQLRGQGRRRLSGSHRRVAPPVSGRQQRPGPLRNLPSELDGPFVRPSRTKRKEYVANEAYKDVPGAVFVQGTSPRTRTAPCMPSTTSCCRRPVPASEGLSGYMEQSDVYKALADAFALGAPAK